MVNFHETSSHRSFPTSDASPQNLAPRIRDSTIHGEFFVAAGAVRNKCANQVTNHCLWKNYMEYYWNITEYIYIYLHTCKKMVMESLYTIDLQLRVHHQ